MTNEAASITESDFLIFLSPLQFEKMILKNRTIDTQNKTDICQPPIRLPFEAFRGLRGFRRASTAMAEYSRISVPRMM
jgi:hypothetical protein